MARNQFQNILRFFHFADNANLDANDRMTEVRYVYNTLTDRFTQNSNPQQHLSLDEVILAWSGKLKLNEIPNFQIKRICE